MRISELLVPLQNAVLGRGKTAQNHSPRTGKHHGSEGRRRRKKGGEKLPNVTSETHRKWGFLSYLSRSKTRLLGRGKTAQNHSPRTGKHHGSEGRRRRKKGGEKLPNVTSETHRKWGFLSYLSRSKTRFLGEERPRKTTAPGRGNTMAVKDGEGGKKAAKNCLT